MLTHSRAPFPQSAHYSCRSGRLELRLGPVTRPGPPAPVSAAWLFRPLRPLSFLLLSSAGSSCGKQSRRREGGK